jgi:hypothetical protein
LMNTRTPAQKEARFSHASKSLSETPVGGK